ncbi:hypothetical protein GALL_474110 [mine drainage metagenome]|uniref:Uncharacterized protein n=1 Tax=mine drainage metagenome TaxID=410659 RepID=A0A1J5PTQ9_9ZZZZ
MLDGGFHELVVSRVKTHQVDALAETVVAVELGYELVGQTSQFEVIGGPRHPAKLDEFALGPLAALAPHRLGQGSVLGVHVVVAQLGREVEEFMRVGQVGRGLCGFNSCVHFRTPNFLQA